ncbi:MAG: arsenite methyltransferase [Armatimonadota bacterium]|nr:arsenite methyltransferase [Armatimonadota bacterium]MDR7422018.1 arsenite methyltransferase [Armatimonadota bacterium]MDR7454155.1 arsenite methyltransferase [Armatimonadota bacterium]MDR7455718.1 arsenite methyltransferase [Armatimonadota bacterium]MDR7496963.1 arsenite methyltransferase [Armatimonadota bacterium]
MTVPTIAMDPQAIRDAVRERYARAATRTSGCCAPAPEASCCGNAGPDPCGGEVPVAFTDGRALPGDLASASLGCGAPLEAAALRPGETVVDLGSGAGLDVFFAADRVGPAGRAIGVDMTPEMVAKARANRERLGIAQAEFRLGEIEHLPVADATADVVISNCVINLLPDKRPAFGEAHRVLRPGGRLVVSDIVSREPLPEAYRTAERWTACLGGAIPEDEYLALVREAGFEAVEVVARRPYADGRLFSVTVRGHKPVRA